MISVPTALAQVLLKWAERQKNNAVLKEICSAADLALNWETECRITK